MSTLETQPKSFEQFEKDVPWYQRFPFGDDEPYAVKVAANEARYLSAAPDPEGLKLASILIYTSTPAMTIGFSPVPPGDWFTPGNHPNAEAYFLLGGEMTIFNPETGQYEVMRTGDAYAIPAMSFHGGINTGNETADILWAIPKHVWTEEFRANPEYDAHYSLLRDPIALNQEAIHRFKRHDSWAQPGFRPGDAPESYLDDLRCWPPRDGKRVHRDHDVDHVVMTERDWLHFATGSNYAHSILTSFCYAQPDFQAGRVRLPMGRVSSRMTLPGERVYFPRGDKPFTVILSDSKDALTGIEGDALYVPAGVTHQVHNINAHVVDAYFFGATPEGVSFTD
jgi:mannose-6-phosphate isomerase-like protein (cupin superfamily)